MWMHASLYAESATLADAADENEASGDEVEAAVVALRDQRARPFGAAGRGRWLAAACVASVAAFSSWFTYELTRRGDVATLAAGRPPAEASSPNWRASSVTMLSVGTRWKSFSSVRSWLNNPG